MKHQTLNRTITAALLTLVATAAYSQSTALTAKIPFAFRAVGSELPAGKYKVVAAAGPSAGSRTMELTNVDTGKAVFIPIKTPANESENGKPRLIFRCASDEGCALTSLWSGQGTGMEFSAPALTPSQKERYETVYLERVKAK
jgi:hypothetical protein